jgi:hypothetical protein
MSSLNSININYILKSLFILFVIYIGYEIFININNSLFGGWSAGEILINYEGGFVRRGLFGQLFLQTGSPLYFAILSQKIVIFLFLLMLIFYILKEKNSTLIFSVLFLMTISAGGFVDILSGGKWQYLDRKEVWFYLALMLILFTHIFFNFKSKVGLITTTLISSLMILHHEIFAIFFAPIIFLLMILNCYGEKKFILRSFLIYLVPISIIFFAVFFNHGDGNNVMAILESYQGTDAANVRGGINALEMTLEQSHSLSIRMSRKGSLFPWIFFLTFSLLCCIVLTFITSYSIKILIIRLVILTWLLLSVLIAGYVGWDWGRWISMLTISYPIFLAFSSFVNLSSEDHEKVNLNQTLHFNKTLYILILSSFLVLIILLSLTSRLPICCPVDALILKWE